MRTKNPVMKLFFSRLSLVALFTVAALFSLSAQEEEVNVGFMNPTIQFSKKKTSYVTLMDGTELVGNVKDFDRKKGIIKYIKLKGNDGKTYKLEAAEIKHGYFQPSALSKLNSFYDDMKVQHWGKDLNEEMFTNGYVYLEQSPVKIKKKTVNLLLQLVNPHFSDGVKVYHDPFAKETASIGIGPMSVGGDAKSFYVKKNGDDVAVRLKKKDYNTEFPAYFGNCPSVKNSKKAKWSDFAEHCYIYAEECNN